MWSGGVEKIWRGVKKMWTGGGCKMCLSRNSEIFQGYSWCGLGTAENVDCENVWGWSAKKIKYVVDGP